MSDKTTNHPPAKHHGAGQKGIPVKIVVERENSAPRRPTPATMRTATPAAVTTDSPSPAKVSTPSTPTLQRKIADVSPDQKRRLMWGIVGTGMVIIVISWVMTFGATLQGSGRGNSLLSGITDIFHKNSQSKDKRNPKNEEIRQLEEQVFPQFQ